MTLEIFKKFLVKWECNNLEKCIYKNCSENYRKSRCTSCEIFTDLYTEKIPTVQNHIQKYHTGMLFSITEI